jgi:putative endonuclease
MPQDVWHLYILDCDGTALYTGISTDPERRLDEHRQAGTEAAKSLRRYARLRRVYSLAVGPKPLALKLERRIKSLSRSDKQSLISSAPSLDELLELLKLHDGDDRDRPG